MTAYGMQRKKGIFSACTSERDRHRESFFVCTVVGFGEMEELATGKKVDLVESCWTEYSQTRPGDSNRKDKTSAQPSKEESKTV